MERLKKNIALLLIGIFSFPILFQSIHITWHHALKYEQHQSGCKAHSSESGNIKHVQTPQENDLCIICEYQFSINDIPKVAILWFVTSNITGHINEQSAQVPFVHFIAPKSSRAPPVVYS